MFIRNISPFITLEFTVDTKQQQKLSVICLNHEEFHWVGMKVSRSFLSNLLISHECM